MSPTPLIPTILIKDSFLFVLVFLALNSCEGQSDEAERNYVAAKEKFSKQFIDHLPTKLPKISSLTISEDEIISHPGIWVKGEFTRNILDSIEGACSRIAKAKYKAIDTCLLVIDRHLNSNNWVNFEKSSLTPPEPVAAYSACTENKLPVPKFWQDLWYETSKTETNLDTNYELYVLEARPGIYLDLHKLPNGKFTPTGWTHGYSKGAAINRKTSTIIFWIDIW